MDDVALAEYERYCEWCDTYLDAACNPVIEATRGETC